MGFSFNKNMFLVLMAFLCFFVLLLASGCIAGHGSSYRDITAGGVQSRRERSSYRDITASGVQSRRELRKAPSGPDPIHHNAAHPKNPTSTSPPTRHLLIRP